MAGLRLLNRVHRERADRVSHTGVIDLRHDKKTAWNEVFGWMRAAGTVHSQMRLVPKCGWLPASMVVRMFSSCCCGYVKRTSGPSHTRIMRFRLSSNSGFAGRASAKWCEFGFGDTVFLRSNVSD